MAQTNVSWRPQEYRLAPRLQGQDAAAPLAQLKIEAWLSPMSDHFPTPRAVPSSLPSSLPAPATPSSASSASGFASSPSNSSDAWNRTSIDTVTTQFDDIYDVSDQELHEPPCRLRRSCSVKPSRQSSLRTSRRTSHRKQPARLVIPTVGSDADVWLATPQEPKAAASTIASSVQLRMTPVHLVTMPSDQQLGLPAPSAPPSLDGSLSSDQMASLTAPSTPLVAGDDPVSPEAWDGVHLQPSALATLKALAGHQDIDCQFSHDPSSPEMRQQSFPLAASLFPLNNRREALSPSHHRQSLADLTSLDIPSPGGFFANLSPRSRSTWHMQSMPANHSPLPTSATAEKFYRQSDCLDVPVIAASQPQNQIPLSNALRLELHDAMSQNTTPQQPQSRFAASIAIEPDTQDKHFGSIQDSMDSNMDSNMDSTIASPAEHVPNEIVTNYDPGYARKLQKIALSNLQNTQHWLLAQQAYMCAINGPDLNAVTPDTQAQQVTQELNRNKTSAPKKKVVHFSVTDTEAASQQQPPLPLEESAFYQAFQRHVDQCQPQDVFVHQLVRFEALQAQRVALVEQHRNQLLGKYQLNVDPPCPKPELNSDETLGRLRKQRIFEAKEQMTVCNWHVAASKLVHGGQLVSAPAAKRLARQSCLANTHGVARRRQVRILDLGGQSMCGWAWHCALQYPNAEVYTATTQAHHQQPCDTNICGPPNHKHVTVEQLGKLPFPDDHFDVVSARELHGILKMVGEHGQNEWDSCLKECMRVLKPGGYLDFSILDSDIINAGPLGLAKSVEFGFSLKTLGYDASPTKTWLRRLDCAGFEQIRRTWLFLPLGPRPKASCVVPDCNVHGNCNGADCNGAEAGSVDNIAAACSIAGSWSWERWLLRCKIEKLAGGRRLDGAEARLLEAEAGRCLSGVHHVIEEGRKCKAGFRMLNGYARKPRMHKHSEVIQIALQE